MIFLSSRTSHTSPFRAKLGAKPQNKYLAVVTQHKTINLQSTPITTTPGSAGENIQACSQPLLLHDCSSHRGKRRGSRTAPIRTPTRHAFLGANAPGPNSARSERFLVSQWVRPPTSKPPNKTASQEKQCSCSAFQRYRDAWVGYDTEGALSSFSGRVL